MPNRSSALILFTVLALALLPRSAQAHRLDAQAFVLKDGKIQIEAWFSSSGPAAAARVQVFRSEGKLLTEGQTNSDGIFVFSCAEPETLKVVISEGTGHRKELTIARDDLARNASRGESVGPTSSSQGQLSEKPVALADHDPGLPVKDVVIGVGFLLAVAAFVLSLRNARRLRELSEGCKRSQGQNQV